MPSTWSRWAWVRRTQSSRRKPRPLRAAGAGFPHHSRPGTGGGAYDQRRQPSIRQPAHRRRCQGKTTSNKLPSPRERDVKAHHDRSPADPKLGRWNEFQEIAPLHPDVASLSTSCYRRDESSVTGGRCASRRLDRRRRDRHRAAEGRSRGNRAGALARIEGAVGKGETVKLVGFGRFEVHERSARRGRNLRTGESLKIPATRVVRFKIGKRLREAAARSKRKRAGKGGK